MRYENYVVQVDPVSGWSIFLASNGYTFGYCFTGYSVPRLALEEARSGEHQQVLMSENIDHEFERLGGSKSSKADKLTFIACELLRRRLNEMAKLRPHPDCPTCACASAK